MNKTGSFHSWRSFCISDRVNQLIDQERQEPDPAKRKQIFAEIQDILAEDVPFVPLWQNEDYAFAQLGLDGVRLEPTQQFIFGPMKKS